ncbi:MAG: hypothetical protein LQ340_006764 [Diploschistes diacapsis]|nr:MAG: hypothetical protein LQ340_006764 [Diploschistes diacapsis]
MEVLHKQGKLLLLKTAGDYQFPNYVHFILISLMFSLVLGLSLGQWVMKAIRRKRKLQGHKAKKLSLASAKRRKCTRFFPPPLDYSTVYGTGNIFDGSTSSGWFSPAFIPKDQLILPTAYRGSHSSDLPRFWQVRFALRQRLALALHRLKQAFRHSGRNIEAYLIYQPGNIPLLNKPLPCNGTILAIAAMYLLVLIFLVLGVPFRDDYPLILADRAGPLMVTLLPALYVFAAKNQPLQYLTGYSYEDLSIFHRRLGEAVVGLGLFHSVGKFTLWYGSLQPKEVELHTRAALEFLVCGLGQVSMWELLYLTSTEPFRERYYRHFILIHQWLQFIGLLYLGWHAPMSRPYVIVSFLIFFVDRIIYRTFMRTRNVIAQVKIYPDQRTVNLRVDKESNGFQTCKLLKKFFKQSFKGDWLPTHHAFVRVHCLDKHKNDLRPYFIACAAPSERPWSSVIDLNLVIPARGAFSQELLKYARRPAMFVDIDGPYGSTYASNMLYDRDICILIAGGAGIAGVWPLVWSLVDEDLNTDLEARTNIQCRQEVLLIWAYKELHDIEWVGGQREIDFLESVGIRVVLAGPTESRGRPDLEYNIEWWMERHDPNEKLRTGIVCCGPPGMQRLVRNVAAKEIAAGKKVSYCDLSFYL